MSQAAPSLKIPALEVPSYRILVQEVFITSDLSSVITVDSPDGTPRRLHDSYRDKLNLAYCQYSVDCTAETRAAYLKALKNFADLVLRDKPTPHQE